jgi:hypothetical protein
MKKLTALVLISLLATLSSRAVVLFQDALNYPNGCIETDGLWYAYAPVAPHLDALIANDLLILNQNDYDSVAAPSSNFTNTPGNTIVFASFTVNVSTLPSSNGTFFASFKDSTNDYVGNIFIATKGTTVPGTYRLGIDNAGASPSTLGLNYFPLDLATGITYQVVYSYDTNLSDSYPNATLWVNPVTINDFNVFGTDTPTNAAQISIPISQVTFSVYSGQGAEAIGKVIVGSTFGDVQPNTPQLPVIGIGPQGTNLYQNDNITLYVAASGLGMLSYQWLSNNVPLTDDGVTVIGSATNVLNLIGLQNTANYSVAVANSAGSVTSAVAVVSVNTTPTPPFFTLQPQGVTNSLFSPITLVAQANGTGPISYEWFFEATGANTFSDTGVSGPTYTFTASYPSSGAYYVTATGGAGSPQNSVTVQVLVIPPPLISIATLKTNIINNNSTYYVINGGQVFNVEGVVTSIGDVLSGSTSEFYIQDGTGACLVYRNGFGSSNTPPVGALVQVISPAESYYGTVEMDPTSGASTNFVGVISYNNPLPATVPLNFNLWVSNNAAALGTYDWTNGNSLVTLTNVYIYTNATGVAAGAGAYFPTNSSRILYLYQRPYSAGQPYMLTYVYTYTNILNQSNTNYWGKPIPNFCYEITGINGVYSALTNGGRFYPTRYADFVTTEPASITNSISNAKGVSQISWTPVLTGSTYSVYSATNISGPWTQTFGLSYYPSTGIYTVTNAVPAQFYKVSTP